MKLLFKTLIKKACKYTVLSILFVITILSSVNVALISYAQSAINVKYEQSDPYDDLKSIDLSEYVYDETQEPRLIYFAESCYSTDVNKINDYGLYLYIYNPQKAVFSKDAGRNVVTMASSYNEDGTPSAYNKFALKFCSKSKAEGYEDLIYKFKVVDDRNSIYSRVNPEERRYDISGIELLDESNNLPTESRIGGTFKFKGFAKGYGDNKNESTLTCDYTELETIELEVHKTNFRTGEYKTNYRHDLTSVYFSVPQRFFDEYGKLQGVKAEWYEYQTQPILVTSNSTVYNGLSKQVGIETQNELQYSFYKNARQYSSDGGHYYHYTFAYNAPGVADERLNQLTLLFSTEGKNISNYILSGERLKAYIEGYDKSFINGTIELPGKSLSADLFVKDLAPERLNISYVGDDTHHKLMMFDADDTFDMLNFNASNSDAYKFFATVFGMAPTEIDDSYKDISPIYIVKKEDRNDANIAKNLLISDNEAELNEFKNYYDAETEKGNKVVLFRFAQTDYRVAPVEVYDEYSGKCISKESAGTFSYTDSPDTFIAQESLFYNFDVIELKFSKAGVYTVIPVISNPIDIYNDVTIPEVDLPWWYSVLAWLIFIIALIVGFLVVTGVYKSAISIIGGHSHWGWKVALSLPIIAIVVLIGVFGVPWVVEVIAGYGGL